MEGSYPGRVLLVILIIFHFSVHINASTTRPVRSSSRPRISHKNREDHYIKTSCKTTLYPKLCYRSLSSYANKIKTDPKILAHTALNVTLTATRSTSRLMRRISKIRTLRRRERAAIADCVEVVGDSVEELHRSMEEMDSASETNFTAVMSDVQTWVSAAMTDDGTCMDGCEEGAIRGRVKILVRRHIVRIAHLTSNALVFVNSYASSTGNLP
ncbi:hypothetical protein Tsubulata_013547 [Turnera subulata]|uniref:Pectinesterase inhibitor domain-containing protein n=1 Tax=Turnera subulata TaxID=218843 RepID=A0A9Q0GCJ3_9ROSI|nr:hypothetical protein Tsubulata_013547 [Turnera subulata]